MNDDYSVGEHIEYLYQHKWCPGVIASVQPITVEDVHTGTEQSFDAIRKNKLYELNVIGLPIFFFWTFLV